MVIASPEPIPLRVNGNSIAKFKRGPIAKTYKKLILMLNDKHKK